jgi:hypothetical protein
MMVTVIGRGHSGTRAISQTLSASGVYMGAQLNPSGDLVPADDFYEACRVLARHVRYLGGVRWDVSALHAMPIDPEFVRLVEAYLASVLASPAPHRGWKLPETSLAYPWIVRMFPDLHYIYWVRDPRDCILGDHLTDDLARFGVPCEPTDDLRRRRAISWKYQADVYRATPRPARLLEVRLEDFVLDQDATLRRLEAFLGIPLAKVPVKPEVVGRWRTDAGVHDFDFFREELVRLGYARGIGRRAATARRNGSGRPPARARDPGIAGV